MKASIVVFSQTGHTIFFARAVAEHLGKVGYDVDIELLRTRKFARPHARDIELRKIPDPSQYDVIVVGGPVWGFEVNPVTAAYLDSIETLKGKRAAAIATHALPKALGCTRALRRLTGKLEALGAQVAHTEGLHWLFSVNRRRMEEAAKRIAERLSPITGSPPAPK